VFPSPHFPPNISIFEARFSFSYLAYAWPSNSLKPFPETESYLCVLFVLASFEGFLFPIFSTFPLPRNSHKLRFFAVLLFLPPHHPLLLFDKLGIDRFFRTRSYIFPVFFSAFFDLFLSVTWIRHPFVFFLPWEPSFFVFPPMLGPFRFLLISPWIFRPVHTVPVYQETP